MRIAIPNLELSSCETATVVPISWRCVYYNRHLAAVVPTTLTSDALSAFCPASILRSVCFSSDSVFFATSPMTGLSSEYQQ